jgi:hypothetical protein
MVEIVRFSMVEARSSWEYLLARNGTQIGRAHSLPSMSEGICSSAGIPCGDVSETAADHGLAQVA